MSKAGKDVENDNLGGLTRFCIALGFGAAGALFGFLLGHRMNVPSYVACALGFFAFLIGLLLPNHVKQELEKRANLYFFILVGSCIVSCLIFSVFCPAKPAGALARTLNGDFEILVISITDSLEISKLAYIELIGIDVDGRWIVLDKIDLENHPGYSPYPYYISKADRDLFDNINYIQLRLYEKPSGLKPEGELISVKVVWTYYGLKSKDIEILDNGYLIKI